MTRELLRAPNHDRRRSLGRLAYRWMHHFLLHGPGDVQDVSLFELPLSDELSGLVLDCYALDPDGRRLYDSAFFSRPKGTDKSGQGARFGLFEAFGPCRFAGWAEGGEVYEWMGFRHVFKRGEPLGRPVTYPFLRCMATEEGQTGNVYDNIYRNLREGPLREAFDHLDNVGLTRVYLPQGGEIRPSTASAAGKDGGKETWVDFDETHLYVLPELRRMYATVRRNMAKRKDAEPWSFETSTMYELGRDSIAERSHALGKRLYADPSLPRRFLFDHREAPHDVDLTDDAAVLAALREGYGDASYAPFDRILSEIRDPRNDLADSLRYFFNQASAAASRAFSLTRWLELVRLNEDGTPYRVAKGALIVLGFDGARHRDSTALIGTEVATGFQWPLGIWERPANVDEWSIDEAAVDAVVAEAFSTFNVWRMYADPPYWESAIARWAGRYGDKVVVEWPTNRLRQMAFCVRAYVGAVQEGDVSHDGDERFAAAIGNAVRQPLNFHDDEGKPLYVIRKERTDSPLKIDPAVAGALSWEARNDCLTAGVATDTGPPRLRWL